MSLNCVFMITTFGFLHYWGASWSWSYGSWIYNYLCNQYLSQLKLCVRVPLMAWNTRYSKMWWNLSVTYDRYSGFLHQLKWPPRYNWNIVENGLRHHNPNPVFVTGTYAYHTIHPLLNQSPLCEDIWLNRDIRMSWLSGRRSKFKHIYIYI